MRVTNLKIGQILIKDGNLDQKTLGQCLELQKENGKKIGEILVEGEHITSQMLMQALAKQFSLEYMDLSTITIEERMISVLPENIALANNCVPIAREGKYLTIAMSDPLDYKAVTSIQVYTKLRVTVVLAEEEEIKTKQRELYTSKKAFDEAQEFVSSQMTKGSNDDFEEDKAAIEDQPIIRFVNTMIEEAVYQKASDIHIEALEKSMLIRFRIDGTLIRYMETSHDLLPSVTSRIKFIGGMNIAEKRVPQDGRINYRTENFEVDMRISVLPSVFGEKTVIRITTALGLDLNLDDIGFLPKNRKKMEHFLESHRGIILVTGATGSGKSTTLYTALKNVQRDDINIVTVENPVEMIVPGINQVDINDKAGLTFARVLRSILRQDPDIIMVGEIRDKETAEIAASAAITGHLVLSTLHTYSAASSVVRLVDMGVAPYMVTAALLGVCAQRLVKRLCPHCKEPYTASEEEHNYLGLDESVKLKLYKSVGCEKCNNIGYKGRIAVHEILSVTPAIKTAIHNNASTMQLNDLAIREGMISMRDNLVHLVLEGVTSVAVMVDAAVDEDY